MGGTLLKDEFANFAIGCKADAIKEAAGAEKGHGPDAAMDKFVNCMSISLFSKQDVRDAISKALGNDKTKAEVLELHPDLGKDNGPSMYVGEDGKLVVTPPKKPFIPLTSDNLCTKDKGVCTENSATACTAQTGKWTAKDLCLGSKGRKCCFPLEGTVLPHRDRKCTKAGGVCQLEGSSCAGGGNVVSGKCGGPKERKCCLPGDGGDSTSDGNNSTSDGNNSTSDASQGNSAEDKESSSEEVAEAETKSPLAPKPKVNQKKGDHKCAGKQGVCTANAPSVCTTGDDKWSLPRLCGGGKGRKCCFDFDTQYAAYDNKCNTRHGKCQLRAKSGGKCDGKEVPGLCGGPRARVCCV